MSAARCSDEQDVAAPVSSREPTSRNLGGVHEPSCATAAARTRARAMRGWTSREPPWSRGSACRVCPGRVLVASTGVIGVDLSLEKVTHGVSQALAALSPDGHRNAMSRS